MAGIESVMNTNNQAAPATAGSKAQEQKNQFLQLLVAQLKGQNPLSPMDGSEFVSQLAQFSSLEELVSIRSVLETMQTTLQEPAVSGPNPFQGV
jgi:flagellar basal-body rod modification protein FlgD